jgi:tetratricopeptide (TPR) repeat protein
MSDQIRETVRTILDGVDRLVDAKDYDEALGILEKLSGICPDDPVPYIKRAEILSDRGRNKEALAALEIAAGACPPVSLGAILSCRARVLEAMGDLRFCIDMLKRVVELEPGNSDAWFELGKSYSDLGDHRGTISCLKRVIELTPESPSTWSSLGTSYYNLGMFKEAVDAYDRAIQADPTNEVRWYNKGNALLELGKFTEAVLCFDKVLEHDSNWIEAWNNRGVALDRAGMLQDAEESFLRALNIKPDYTLARKNINIIRAKMRGEDVDDDWLGLDTDEG